MKLRTTIQMKMPLFKEEQTVDEYEFEAEDARAGALSLIATGKVPSDWVLSREGVIHGASMALLRGSYGEAFVMELD